MNILISKFLFFKNGGINSIILLTLSFVFNKVEKNLTNIICKSDKQLKIEFSFFEKADNFFKN